MRQTARENQIQWGTAATVTLTRWCKAVLPLIVLACAMGTTDTASASCGDYLYKPGQKKNEMPAPMEQHDEPECNEHRHIPSPLVPTTHPQRQNDHFVQTVQRHADCVRDGRNNRREQNTTVRQGHPQRIDRPPQR